MASKPSWLRKFSVLLMAFAIVFTYSVVPMSQAYAASAKKPAKVTGVKATAKSATSFKVTWKKAKNAKKYQVYVSTKKTKGFKKVATVKASKKSYTVKKLSKKALKANTRYYVKVRAINGKKKGKFSAVKTVKTKKKAAAAPATPATPAEPGEASEKSATLNNANNRTMTTTIDMSDAKYDGNVVRVWVPVPQSNDEQTVWGEKFDAPAADADKSGFKNESSSGWNNKMLYLEWSADTAAADRKATLSFNVSRYEVSRSNLEENAKAGIPDDVKPYITKESNYVKVNDPIVQKYAAEATKGKTGTLEKARAIYDWCIANLERIDNGEKLEGTDGQTHEFTVVGCGYGDTVQILKDHEEFGRAGGHCTDINSTFVALCRASGIPAREMFGIRLANDATGGQHCWAQFYLPGTGWVYADPGDVLKFGVKENKSNLNMTLAELEAARKSDLTAEYTAKYWGGVDNNRVELSRGRDITLEPAQKAADGAYNTFGYPCGEFGTDEAGYTRIECTNAAAFKYSIACADNTADSGDVAAVVDGTDTATKLVDARTADAFEGWAIDGAANGGHMKNAVNVAAQWLTTEYFSVPAENKTRDESIQKEIDANGLSKDDSIIVYDTNGEDANAVQNYLVGKGYTNIKTYNATADFASAANLESNDAYTQYYVPAEVVKSISDNVVNGTALSDAAKAVVGSKNVKILHAEWYTDVNKTAYAGTGHVPGAVPITTDDFEPERSQRSGDDIIRQEGVTYGNNADISWVGDYLLVDDAKAIELAEKYGVNKDDCVVVVGYEPMATCKIALVLKYLGVDDIYVMSAAYNEWNLKGYDLETKINTPDKTSFGATEPLNPDLIDTQDEAASMLEDPDKYQLVDTRTVEEFAGKDTGYSYHDIAGRIPGAEVNSPSGIGYSSGMYYYRNADKTMRSKAVIEAMWADQGVDTSKHFSFFCGSGWRAAEETWDALAMGYTNVSMYNDGWQGWSNAGRPFIDKDGNTLKLNAEESILVKAVDYKYNYVTAEDVFKDISSGNPEYTVIDVRQTSDNSGLNMGSYSDAHLVTAISAPVRDADNKNLTYKEGAANLEAAGVTADSGKKYVLICYFGGEVAERAFDIAVTYMGISADNLLILRDGMWAMDPDWSFMSDYPYEVPEYMASVGTSNGGVTYNGITPDQLNTDITGTTNLYKVIDVRAAGDYATAHISGAYSAPVRTGDEAVDVANIDAAVNEYGKNAVYCLICYSGNAYADAATALLEAAGVPSNNIVRLAGGQKAWNEKGLATEAAPIDFTTMNDDDWDTYGIDYADISGADFILDARQAANYEAGHLPGAFSADVTVDGYESKLEEAYNAATENNQRIVIICNAGKTLARRAMQYFNSSGKDMNNITYLRGGNNSIPADDKSFLTMNDDLWSTYGIDYANIDPEKDFILDVRQVANYEKGHLPGAVNVDVSTGDIVAGDDVANALDDAYNTAAENGQMIVIVCNAGKGLARKAMQYYNESVGDLTGITYLVGGNTAIPEGDKVTE